MPPLHTRMFNREDAAGITSAYYYSNHGIGVHSRHIQSSIVSDVIRFMKMAKFQRL